MSFAEPHPCRKKKDPPSPLLQQSQSKRQTQHPTKTQTPSRYRRETVGQYTSPEQSQILTQQLKGGPYLAQERRRSGCLTELTWEKFEECRTALRAAFMNCSQDNFLTFTCIISCVLRAQWRLHESEIHAAAELLRATTYRSIIKLDLRRHVQTDWIQQLGSVFKEDVNGFVEFSLPAVPNFLQTCRIRGVDVSHQTIAVACLNQVDIDRRSMQGSPSSLANNAFSAYAAQNLHYHVEMASRESVTVHSQLSRFGELEDKTRDGQVGKSHLESHDFEIVQRAVERLDINDEAEDMAVIDWE